MLLPKATFKWTHTRCILGLDCWSCSTLTVVLFIVHLTLFISTFLTLNEANSFIPPHVFSPFPVILHTGISSLLVLSVNWLDFDVTSTVAHDTDDKVRWNKANTNPLFNNISSLLLLCNLIKEPLSCKHQSSKQNLYLLYLELILM